MDFKAKALLFITWFILCFQGGSAYTSKNQMSDMAYLERMKEVELIKKKFCDQLGPFVDILSTGDKEAICQLCSKDAIKICGDQTIDLAKGQRAYVPIADITPGQVRYAEMNVQEKVANAIAHNNAVKKGNTYLLKFDNGKSILDQKNALPVLKAKDGYVLLDGHHDLLSSMRLGATTVPIEVTQELKNLSIKDPDFWQKAETQKLVFLYNIKGERVATLPRFDMMEDDPNRFFVTLVLHRCNTENGKVVYDYAVSQDVYGHQTPILIKIDKDIPFLEFYVADLLRAYGVEYNNKQGKDFGNFQKGNVLVDLAEKARDILRDHAGQLAQKGIVLKVVPYKRSFSRAMCQEFMYTK